MRRSCGLLVKAQATARVDVPTAPRQCCFFFLNSLMSALFLTLRRTSHHIGMKNDVTVRDPGLSDPARCAHLPSNEFKIDCLFLRKPFRGQKVFPKCFSTAPRCSMRSSSSVDLDFSSLDDVRTERADIAMSVGLSWPPVKRWRSAGRPSWQQLWERALQEHILHHHELPHGVRLQRPVWWRPGETIDRPLTHEEIARVKTPRSAPATPSTPAAALVEDEPAAARQNTAKSRSTPSCATGSSTCWTSGGHNGGGACSGAWLKFPVESGSESSCMAST